MQLSGILVSEEGDCGRAIRIILEALNDCFALLVALEVDNTVDLTMPAASMPYSDPTATAMTSEDTKGQRLGTG